MKATPPKISKGGKQKANKGARTRASPYFGAVLPHCGFVWLLAAPPAVGLQTQRSFREERSARAHAHKSIHMNDRTHLRATSLHTHINSMTMCSEKVHTYNVSENENF